MGKLVRLKLPECHTEVDGALVALRVLQDGKDDDLGRTMRIAIDTIQQLELFRTAVRRMFGEDDMVLKATRPAGEPRTWTAEEIDKYMVDHVLTRDESHYFARLLCTQQALASDVFQLAREFCIEMRHDLTDEQFNQVIMRNALQEDPLICHSHDFCDANMVMDAAWNRDRDTGPDLESDKDTELWNKAWDMAKASGFQLGQEGK